MSQISQAVDDAQKQTYHAPQVRELGQLGDLTGNFGSQAPDSASYESGGDD